MIILAILGTLAAAVLTFLIFGANGMRSAPGKFEYGSWIIAAWSIALCLWLGWRFF